HYFYFFSLCLTSSVNDGEGRRPMLTFTPCWVTLFLCAFLIFSFSIFGLIYKKEAENSLPKKFTSFATSPFLAPFPKTRPKTHSGSRTARVADKSIKAFCVKSLFCDCCYSS